MKPGNQRTVLEYLQQHGEPANTHDVMSACKLDSRQVGTAVKGLIDKGLITKRVAPAMLKGPQRYMHQGKLRVYELTEKGRSER